MSRMILVFRISILLTAFDGQAFQHRGVTVYEPPDDAFAASGFDASSSRGLFVGISSFSKHGTGDSASESFATIPYAVDDAVDLAHFFSLYLKLIDPEGVTICLAGEPKKEQSRLRLKELMEAGASIDVPERNVLFAFLSRASRESRPEGILIVSFATHGFSLEGSDFLVASDSSPYSIANTGLEVSKVLDEVSQSNTAKRLVLLDACRERLKEGTDRRAGGADKESAMGRAFADAIASSSGIVVMAGARAGGYAFDDHVRRNGVFTASILEGLAGETPADGRGFITPANLGKTVNEKVCRWASHNQKASPDQCGITMQVEGPAGDMPLAVDPTTYLPPEEYRLLVRGFRNKLMENFGEHISGQMYDKLNDALPEYYPAEADRRRLLDELFEQARDLNQKNQVRFVPYLDFWFQKWHDVAPVVSRAPDPVPNRRKTPSKGREDAGPVATLDISALSGVRLTVKVGSSKSRPYCARLTQAGLNVECMETSTAGSINKLTLKCPDLPKETGDILKSFLGLRQLRVDDLRRKYLQNRTICNRAGGAELSVAN